jgi:hypothetical protein
MYEQANIIFMILIINNMIQKFKNKCFNYIIFRFNFAGNYYNNKRNSNNYPLY